MADLYIGTSQLTGTIFCGKISKDKRMWLKGKQDLTIEALVAVAEHVVRFGKPVEISKADGTPEYRITVERLESTPPKRLLTTKRGKCMYKQKDLSNGLKITQSDDMGIFLHFKTKDGRESGVSLDNEGMKSHQYDWAVEQLKDVDDEVVYAKNVARKVMWECAECGHTNLSDESLINGKDNIICCMCDTANHVSV